MWGGGGAAHLSLEVEQAQGLELDVGLGAQVSGQRAGQVLQLLDAVGNAGLQPTERFIILNLHRN